MDIVEVLKSWVGAKKGDKKHQEIVDIYNSYLPHPRGYELTLKDSWCAATISSAAIKCGLTDIIPIECSCTKQMEAYKAMGRWIEDDSHIPSVGEQVFYDWEDNGIGDNKGDIDHTVLVVWVGKDKKTFKVIEGNKGNDSVCNYRVLKVNDRYIRGFGSPNYPQDQKEKEVFSFGDLDNRVKILQELLNSVGYELEVDGDFGELTEKAWNEYVINYLKLNL